MNSVDDLFKLAAGIRLKAYAPYSGYLVGTCIETENASLHVGCNIENASYGLAVCSEANAIAAMIAAGETKIRQLAIVVAGPIAAPCGGCRQRISEFASPETVIHLGDLAGNRKSFTLAELLPFAFGPEYLIGNHP